MKEVNQRKEKKGKQTDGHLFPCKKEVSFGQVNDRLDGAIKHVIYLFFDIEGSKSKEIERGKKKDGHLFSCKNERLK